MKRALSVVAVVAVIGALASSSAFAHGARGGSSGFRGGHFAGSSRSGTGGFVHKRFSAPQKSVFPQPVDPWKSWGGSAKHHGNHDLAFAPFVGATGFIGTPSVIVTAPTVPLVVEASPVIHVSPVISAPAAVALPGPAALPIPTLVDYPGGWYQLRGDGATTPYRWIWIPKPPVSPEPSSDPTPPAQGADTPARPTESRARDSRGQAYHWTDDRGVTTWTNRLEKVPKRFRDQAAASAQPE